MTFGEAMEAVKHGKRIQREGWNGKNQYVELATGISYKNTAGDIVNVNHDAIGNQALAFVGTSGVQLGWLASQADMLADDWVVIIHGNFHVEYDSDEGKGLFKCGQHLYRVSHADYTNAPNGDIQVTLKLNKL